MTSEKTDASFARLYVASQCGIPNAYEEYADKLKQLNWEYIRSGPNQFCTRRSCWLVMKPCACFYKYGGRQYDPSFFPPWLSRLTARVEDLVGVARGTFNSCNANWYSEASHSLNYHADNEWLFKPADKNVFIVSLSFGQSRLFKIRKKLGLTHITICLNDGDVFTMGGKMQESYEHSVSRCSEHSSNSSHGPTERFNLTWRTIVNHVDKCPPKSKQ